MSKKPKSLPIPEVDETKFVSEMYVPMLQVTHYDDDFIKGLARQIRAEHKLSKSLVQVFNCHVVNGVIESMEPLEYEA